jgi:hypothetical protein
VLYLHPSDQLLAYEWNSGKVNPHGHAWATFALYFTEMQLRDQGDVLWLKSLFQKLLMDFHLVVNRKGLGERNVFEGSFLGPDK